MAGVSRLIQGLTLVGSGVGLIPIIGPQAQEVLELVIKICEMAEDVRSNAERWKLLAEHAAKLVEELVSLLKTMNPESLSRRQAEIEDLLKVLTEIAKMYEAQLTKGTVVRWWEKDEDEEEAIRLQISLDSAIARFGVLAQVRASDTLEEIKSDVSAVRSLFVANASNTKPTFAEGERGLLLELKPIYEAHFDHGNARPGCLKHTREVILEDIYKWIDDPHAPEIIRWLAGLAGTGKSTIAQTVCETLAASGRLGASFFFSRSSEEQRQQGNVIRTIAFQLAHVSPHLKSLVLDAMRNNADIVTRSMQQQALLLIAGPLSTATDIPSPLVFVFDALDECEGEGDRLVPLLVHTLGNLQSNIQCKMFVTSRLEQGIRGMFNTIDHRAYKLHEVEASLVDSDIRRYFAACFTRIAANRPGLNLNEWPSEDEMSKLVARTGRLFIYAATVVKYVDVKGASPRTRLASLLDHTGSMGSSPFRQVDDVYLHILESACKVDAVNDEERTLQIRMVAGTVVLLFEPLPKGAICALNTGSSEETETILEDLHAVLVLPDERSSDQSTVRILHPSFADFLINRSRCTNHRLLVNSEERHTLLAIRCLEVMDEGLKRDICNIRNPSLLNSEVLGLSTRVAQTFSPILAYVCKYWLSHLRYASLNHAPLNKSIQKFTERHILNWVEACSLLECLPTVLAGLRNLPTWPTASSVWTHSRTLLSDTERLIMDFYSPIRASALHVHYSAVPLLPDCALREQYSAVFSGAPRLLIGRHHQWNATLQIIEGHTAGVVAMVLSSNDAYIVSGSDDHTVRIWDASTCISIAVLEGHTDTVWSVAISPNRSRVVSGSKDETVRVWDVVTGVCLMTLRDGSSAVDTVVISPDGSYYASGSMDSVIRVWNAENGELQKKFSGDTRGILSVAYASDGLQLISGSFDGFVCIWDAIIGDKTSVFHGHTEAVLEVAISHDGSMIASASDDSTIRIWSPKSRKSSRVLKGHRGGVNSVAFSPNDRHLVSGGDDGTVRVWDTESGALISTFAGHASWVLALAISSDGSRIFSSAADGTIRVWDISSTVGRDVELLVNKTKADQDNKAESSRRKGKFGIRKMIHSAVEGIKHGSFDRGAYRGANFSMKNSVSDIADRVMGFAVSQDQSAVITGHRSGSVRLHKASPLGVFTTKILANHEDSVEGVDMSLNTQIAASCANDGVYVWNVRNGRRIWKSARELRCRSVGVLPDGLTLVAGTAHGPIMMWKVNTWAQQPSFDGHNNSVWSLGFSSDGSKMASGSYDGSIRIWSIHTNTCLSTLDRGSPILYTLFTPDGSQLGSVTQSGSVYTWDVLAEDTPCLDNQRPALFHIDESGWLFGPLPSNSSVARRLCWIPPYRRQTSPWDFRCFFSSGKILFVSEAGLITHLDISDLLVFISELD